MLLFFLVLIPDRRGSRARHRSTPNPGIEPHVYRHCDHVEGGFPVLLHYMVIEDFE